MTSVWGFGVVQGSPGNLPRFVPTGCYWEPTMPNKPSSLKREDVTGDPRGSSPRRMLSRICCCIHLASFVSSFPRVTAPTSPRSSHWTLLFELNNYPTIQKRIMEMDGRPNSRQCNQCPDTDTKQMMEVNDLEKRRGPQ